MRVTLLELQRRMTEDVCRPLTDDFAMQERTDDGHAVADIAASYVAPNALLSSFDRLEIYNKQYWLRAIGAVSEDFPALEAVLGRDRFDSLVIAYLKRTPSTSWNLRDLSGAMPAFVEAHPELAGRRHRLASDVARLEWAYIEAYDGRKLPALTSEDMQTLGPHSRLAVQPHVQLLALEYPVDDLVLKVKQQRPESEVVSNASLGRKAHERMKLSAVRREKVYLAVHRFDDSVYYRRMEREPFLLLNALRSGTSIEGALQAAFHRTRKSPAEQATAVQDGLALAAELGWLTLAE